MGRFAVGLLAYIMASVILVGALPVHAQTPPRPTLNGIPSNICKNTAVSRCTAGCADVGQCIFGCEIGGINNVDTCSSSCTGLGAPCLNACLQVIDSITLCAYPTVGGTVSGLGAGRSVVLRNNGGDDLTVSANGAFTFPMWITLNDTYAVTVSAQPTDQNCIVANGSGLADSPAVVVTPYGVTNVAVTCSSPVPTMSEWGKILLVATLAIGGLLLLGPTLGRIPRGRAS